MMKEKNKSKNSIGRFILVILAFILQTLWIIIQVAKLNQYSNTISVITNLITLCVVLRINLMEANGDIKMTWSIVILLFPIMGLCLYLMYGTKDASKRKRVKIEAIDKKLQTWMKQDEKILKNMEKRDILAANQARYISQYGNYPVYQNTDIQFYKDASLGLEAQLKELEKAEKFIFMEYHAIEDAESFGRIKEILVRKAAEGVEVRLFYDDVGSIGFITPEFIGEMKKQGIQCRIFNRLVPMLSIFMNNRDHRKITVIDGKVGFTGGYNLADEYFNITHPYGYWKDTGVRLEGDAVQSLTVLFLQMWNFIKETDGNYDKYLERKKYTARETGYVQPYADNPLYNERVGENVYLNIVKNAKRYVYFITPYLIVSNEMSKELTLAAKRGVDVRIITPGIPDKKFIYRVTRSYYTQLVTNGVKIYEFTPGFCHAKQCVCDDEIATVGTINLDYRSMYHHFENAVWMYKTSVIHAIREDFEETFEKSEDVMQKYSDRQRGRVHFGDGIVRLIAPLL